VDERRGSATIPDVARLAGVSTATAARALGNYGSVSPATREKVEQAAAALGYRANSLARSMVTGTTNTLGVVLSDIENPFFSRVLRGISDVAHEAGFEVVLVNTDESSDTERNAVRVLTEKRVDGLLVCPADAGSTEHLRSVAEAGTPLVLVDRRIKQVPADSVVVDNRAAARAATQRLTELGHRRIGLITGMDGELGERFAVPGLRGIERALINTTAGRAAGYRDALVEAGVEVRSEYVVSEGFRREDAVRATKQLMALDRPPTAILALDSLLALGTMQALRELGVRCPDDVSLVGFDDADWTEAVTPPLTVVAQPVQRIGSEACRLLLERIEGSTRPPVHRVLRTELVERGSVAPAPQRHRADRVSS